MYGDTKTKRDRLGRTLEMPVWLLAILVAIIFGLLLISGGEAIV